jgi:hypothetical protein
MRWYWVRSRRGIPVTFLLQYTREAAIESLSGRRHDPSTRRGSMSEQLKGTTYMTPVGEK